MANSPTGNLRSGYCVVIPTYNNQATLRDVVTGALAVLPTVIVVDDGSDDGAGETIADLPIVVLRHKRNRGKGNALRTGLRHAQSLGYSHAVTLDSDGQHFSSEIPALIEDSLREPDAIVIGVRDMSGEHVPWGGSFGRMFSNFWLKVATGIDAGDTQSGFRVYPLRHVNRVFCIWRKFAWECEALVRMSWGGCPVRTVPIKVHYPPPEERVSHFDPFWDVVRFTALYLYLNFSHLLIPLPHKRLLRAKRPIWTGSIFGSIRQGFRRLRALADLPAAAQLKGGPWARMKQLVRFLARERSTPGELGFSVGLGAFIGCTPLIGLHWLIALYAATRVHTNRLATLAATNVSFGPLTAVIALASIWLGKLLTGSSVYLPATLRWSELSGAAKQALPQWILGSVVIGLAAAFATGLGTLYGVRALRRRRQESEAAPGSEQAVTSEGAVIEESAVAETAVGNDAA